MFVKDNNCTDTVLRTNFTVKVLMSSHTPILTDIKSLSIRIEPESIELNYESKNSLDFELVNQTNIIKCNQQFFDEITLNIQTTYEYTSMANVNTCCDCSICNKYPILYYSILVHVAFSAVVKIIQVLFFYNIISFLMDLQNWIEIVTYVCAALSVNSNDFPTQSAYGSIAVLFSFIIFPLYLKKLKVFGVYVVALLKTMSTSAKFLPLFMILGLGFVLTFYMRYPFGVQLSFENKKSFSYFMLKTFSTVLGDYDTRYMGVMDGDELNIFIYLTFLTLMCVIMLNLLVSIAVSEIKVVLDEADIRHIALKILFVLSVQSAIDPILRKINSNTLTKFFNMRYCDIHEKDKRNITKIIKDLLNKVVRVFTSSYQVAKVHLSDPQRRLIESIDKLHKVIIFYFPTKALVLMIKMI